MVLCKLMPNVDHAELDKFSKLAKNWWDTNGPLKTLHDINPARMHFITQHTALSNKRVLDVGCGGGILSEALHKKEAKVTGIDLEKTAINTATAHATQHALSIDYQHVAIEDLNASPFDIITCYEMLEHVPDPKALVSHLSNHLVPGGLLFLSTLNRTLKAYLLAVLGAEYILRLLPKQTHDYKKFIRPSELAMYARDAGFTVRTMRGLHYNPLTRHAALVEDVDVNYLMLCEKII